MSVSKKRLLENLKAWKAMETFLQMGVSLQESLAVIEADCEDQEMKPKFSDLFIKIEETNGAPLPKDWNSEFFLESTKELLCLAWSVGNLNQYLEPIRKLIFIELNLLENKNSFSPEYIPAHFIILLKNSVPPAKAISIAKSSFNSEASHKLFDELHSTLESGGLLTQVFAKHAGLVTKEFTDRFKLLEETGNPYALLDLLHQNEYKKLIILPKSLETEPDKVKADFYYMLYKDLAGGKVILDAFNAATASLVESPFKTTWEKIFESFVEDQSQIMKTVDQSSLDAKDKAIFKNGFYSGMLDEAFKKMSELAISVY